MKFNARRFGLARWTKPCLAALALLLVAPATGSAQTYPRVRRPPPPRLLAPPPPPVVVYPAPIVVQPPPVVVRPAPVVVQPAPVAVVESHQPDFGSFLSLGVRATGMSMHGYSLYLSDIENPVLGGAGIFLRTRFDEHFGLEFATDFLGGSDGDFKQRQIPLTLSLMFHLFPESRFQPYFLVGAGIQFTQMSYMGGALEHNMTEAMGLVGLGADIWLTERLALSADVRFLGTYRGLGSRTEMTSACYASAASGQGFCADLGGFDSDDRLGGGIQFMAGLSYAF